MIFEFRIESKKLGF